jgi:hypothetical protein
MEPESERLVSMMRENKFGSAHKPYQRPTWELRSLARPLTYTASWLPSISLRRDRALGFGLTFAALDLGQFGYLAPRINFITESNDFSFEGMLTPSASQFFSWYVSAGAAWEHDLEIIELDFDQGSYRMFTDPEWKFVSEIGVKFRVRLQGKWRILSLGYHFAGLRIGFRNSGLDDMKNSRLILEIGAGIF